MKQRSVFMVALAVAAVMLMVPLCAEADDAATAGDIALTLPDGSTGTASVTVGNGAEESFSIIVYNNSADYLMISSSSTTSSEHVSVSATPESNIIEPVAASGSSHYTTVTVTVSVDRYDATDSETAELVLTFSHISGDAESFDVTVPIAIDVDSEYFSVDGSNLFLGFIPNTLSGFLGSEWFTAIVTLVAWIVISFVVCMAVIPLFTRAFTKNSSDDEKRKTKRNLTNMITLLIAILAIDQCLGILGVSPEFRDGFNTLADILYIVIGAMIAWTIYVFIITSVLRGMEKAAESTIDSSLIPLFKMLGKILIAVAAAAAVLAMFGVDLNGILVSAGVITMGITFGAQQVISQFFSGIVLLATRPFKKGDFVNIGGEVYIVRKVKLMCTEFDNWDMDQVVTIPNNVVSGGTIVNMTAEDADARTYIYVNVMYGADLEKAQALMVQAAMEHPHVITDGSRSKPSTRFMEVAGNAVKLRLAAYTDDFDSAGGIAGEIRTRIYQLFEENGVPLPPNAIDVYVKENA